MAAVNQFGGNTPLTVAMRGAHMAVQVARVRFTVGSVPGTANTLGLHWIAVYSKQQDRGWLFLADPDGKGGFMAIRNAYRLTRHGSHWNADEGNGACIRR